MFRRKKKDKKKEAEEPPVAVEEQQEQLPVQSMMNEPEEAPVAEAAAEYLEEPAQQAADAEASDFYPDAEVESPQAQPEQAQPEMEGGYEEEYPADSGNAADISVNNGDSLWLCGYDPSQFQDLPVNAEIKNMFEYITQFKPQIIELETLLKPFVPDYMPAVGDVDPFLKVPRPDGQPDGLGLSVLDEPAGKQSNPAVLQMQLRQHSRALRQGPIKVAKVENAAHEPKEVEAWVDSVEEIHASNPPPAVTYSKPMPEIEALMQEWPAEFEEALQSIPLPPPDIDMDIKDYARYVCAMFDIPVYNNLIESLHMLFQLYSDFKSSEFLAAIGADPQNGAGTDPAPSSRTQSSLTGGFSAR